VNTFSEVHDEFADFFRCLGFIVTWDFSKRTGDHWYEIYAGQELLCQVDFGVPLGDFLEDLRHFARGSTKGAERAPSREHPDYECRCDDTAKLKRILVRLPKGP
jgi:hypothetical protein